MTSSYIPYNLSFESSLDDLLSKANVDEDINGIQTTTDSLANLLENIERIASSSSVRSSIINGSNPKEIQDIQSNNPWNIPRKNVEIESHSRHQSRPRHQLREPNYISDECYTTDEDEDDDILTPLPYNLSSTQLFQDRDALHKVMETLECDCSPVFNSLQSSTNKRKERTVSVTSESEMEQSNDETDRPSRKRRRPGSNQQSSEASLVQDSSASSIGPNLEMMLRFQELVKKSTESQKALQEYDRRNGLPRSHCQTMVNSSRSRKQLQSGFILPKWNGKPLLDIPGVKVLGLHSSRRLLNQDS